ncbi:glutamine--fructose-6-phosphate aminotransferase, partial [Thiotrichales bacterium HSG1]|nr:glutamine--fructose-6-phosphate aminotransferase [Thiotrichales bacterium HSG1]
MCGIVGAVAERDVVPILIEGLKRLEYRGYDSAGVATINYQSNGLEYKKVTGKVHELETKLKDSYLYSSTGIAHTRWATHGKPSVENAHPQISRDVIAIVHNGIIENHLKLRTYLEQRGYEFNSDTDTEVLAHLIHYNFDRDLKIAIRKALKLVKGTYAIAVISPKEPGRLI